LAGKTVILVEILEEIVAFLPFYRLEKFGNTVGMRGNVKMVPTILYSFSTVLHSSPPFSTVLPKFLYSSPTVLESSLH
jgi:hypothetical protein